MKGIALFFVAVAFAGCHQASHVAENASACRMEARGLSNFGNEGYVKPREAPDAASIKEQQLAQKIESCVAGDRDPRDVAVARLESGALFHDAAEHAAAANEMKRAQSLNEKAIRTLNQVDMSRLDKSQAIVLRLLIERARKDRAGQWQELL